MRNSFFIAIILSLLTVFSCNDGDIITVEFDFDDTFHVCEGTNSLVFYKTKNDPSQSLSLRISSLTIDDILAVDETNTYKKDFDITATNPFNYRTYSNATLPTTGLFCSDIPSSDIDITEDLESTTGTATINTILTEDDDDGIPAALEDINGNGDLDDDDTDNDGLPNYIDADDDGDNVLTKDENPDPNKDGNLSDAQDTNGDGTPDYLDNDDDGDGVLTRDEENNTQNQNPVDDVTNNEIGPDYLNPEVHNPPVPATAYKEHVIKQTFVVTLTINNISLPNITQDVLDFGSLENGALTTSRKETPTF